MSMSWAICETFSPACAASPTSGPEIATATNAGMSVISGASSDRKISSSRMRMKTTETPSSSLPVDPDFFCWSTWIATAPARCTCTPGGGLARAIVPRRLSTSVVSPLASPWPTLDSTCSCSA